ncbi:hypothetical protein [Pelagerythrobacter rhizovicinus]|uniref:Uncharacterized protein n=1 Tax=Pelagerythrobacter rhizovicinus TaxID=2268576 RepID=A0A4Q2KMD4_9SPHN|nr:hypothetical protein [Pelagerythrobacter rhizovicinus]RXZ64672.1 hypothetical protein ETX26_12410 [Pelagerythrobacter rhizovicinus]
MNGALAQRIADGLDAAAHPAVAAFAARLAEEAGAAAALFYGSNLRTGELEGVLDFYLLLPGSQTERIWPRVSYHEWEHEGRVLRAKVARIAFATFVRAAEGESRDTTIWARFVQPSALVWISTGEWRPRIVSAIAGAAQTAARLAAALGPESGTAEDYWRALFRATYQAEFRVEKPGREDSILSVNATHFEGLLPLAWEAQGIPFARDGERLAPRLSAAERRRILSWWARRRRFGKPLNLARLVKASTTFDGAARYAAWKIERHTGVPVAITPWRERHPVLAAPGVLFKVWRARRRG